MPDPRPSSRLLLLLVAVLLLAQVALVRTEPTLSFPINSQVPPVARVGQLLDFTFSSSTFAPGSADSTLSYTLGSDPPPWLSLDSDSRRLYGTPQDHEVAPGTVVGVVFTLVAADSTGSTASDNVTLVVSRNPAPTVQVPLAQQIQSFGNYSEPSSILCRSDTDFNFTFAADTFSDPSVSDLTYYAISSNDSPLPSWVSFDATSLSFVGTTPPFTSLVEPPQTFSLKLIASDVVGFSGTWMEFSIVVGSHALSTDEPRIALNVTAGSLLSYDGLVGNIVLDGNPAKPGTNVNATTENLPSWLAFDESSWNITGKAPKSANSTSFIVTFKDQYADTLNVTFDVHVLGNNSSVFSSAFPTLKVEPGKHLSFELAPYLSDSAGVKVTAEIKPATSWLSWDASSLTLSGHVPSSATKSVIDVTFTVNTGNNDTSSSKDRKRAGSGQSQKLTIQVASTTTSSTTSSQTVTSTATSSTSSPTPSTASSQGGSHHRTSNWIIIVAVICAVIGLVLLLGACFCCYHRRKKKRESHNSPDGNDRPSAVHQEYLHIPGLTILGGTDAAHGSPDTEKTTKTSSAAAVFKGNHNVSPNEKEKRNKLRKSSILRSEVARPSSQLVPPAPSATIGASHGEEGDRSDLSTPGSRLKDWFASIRSFRVVQMRRPSPRFSDSNLTDDSDNASHHGLDLDLGPGLSRSGVLSSLRTGSRGSSFRSDVEVGVPMFAAAGRIGDGLHSRQQTPELSPPNRFNLNHSSSENRKVNKGKKRESTPLIPRPLGPTPEGARNRHAIASDIRHSGGGGGGDPFTDSSILGLMTPDIILTSPDTDGGAGPSTFGLPQTTSEKANLQQLLEHSHPYDSYPPAQRRTITEPPHTLGYQRRHPSLRPVRSQVSFAARPAATPSTHNSVSSVDSMRSRTRRFARKASSHAKGAVSLASMALSQPKRRTLAALRKTPHLSLRSSKRSIRAIFVNADEGDVGDIYSPVATSASSRRGRRAGESSSSRRGLGGFLNPRIWPQPSRTASAPGRSESVSPMPWPPTPEVPATGNVGLRAVRASSSSKRPASTIYSNPRRWRAVNKHPRASQSQSSRLGTPRSNNSSSHGSLWSQHRPRRPRASTSRSKLSSSAGGSGSGRLNGHSFRSFRMQQPQMPIRRRPVGAPERERATPQSTYSSAVGPSILSGGGGFPSPLPSLPSPIQENNGGSGGAGLGISIYEDIVSNSPFHPSRGDHASRRSLWTTISGSARGGADNSRNTTDNNNNSSSGGDALDSSTGTLPNWIVFGRAEDLNLNAFGDSTRQYDDNNDYRDTMNMDNASWFGVDASGNRLPNRESPVIRSPLDWRRFGPSWSPPPPLDPSPSVEGGRGGGGGERSSSFSFSSRGGGGGGGGQHEARRRSVFVGGGAFGGAGGGTGLRIVNPGASTTNNTLTTLTSGGNTSGGGEESSATAQTRISEGPTSSGQRVFL